MIRALILFAVSLAIIANATARAADRPNVLLICVDDLKPVLGCYGDEHAHTPNIDQLAARGMRFNAAYCNQAVCAPSRNSLLTGLRPDTLGIYDLGTFFRKSRPDAVTLPQHFKQQGYRAQSLGKIYHRGHGNHDDRRSWSVPSWMPKAAQYQLAESLAGSGESSAPSASSPKVVKGAAYEKADVVDAAYPDGQIADEAIRRLRAAADKPDDPFFLAVGFLKPHLPFCAPARYWDIYDPAEFELPKQTVPPEGAPRFAPTNSAELRGYGNIPKQGDIPQDLVRPLIHGYYAATSYADAQIGRLLTALAETGLADNTIVVLWGDHGWHLGDHGMWCKHTNYEQAARIPLIVVAPGVTEANATTASLVETVDLYPTLCVLADLPVPDELDGQDFSVVLQNPSAKTKEAIFHVYPRGKRLGRSVRTDRYRLVEWKRFGADEPRVVYELYDYQTDPQETKNLASEEPELVSELKSLLAARPPAKPPVMANQ